jgi:cell shape-determining protein MreD
VSQWQQCVVVMMATAILVLFQAQLLSVIREVHFNVRLNWGNVEKIPQTVSTGVAQEIYALNFSH